MKLYERLIYRIFKSKRLNENGKSKRLNEKGYSTIFFALMTLAFLSVFSLCANTLMQMIQSNEQMRQASLASRNMLSYYDDALEADYGLMAYNLSEVKAEAFFAPYFQNDWKVTPTEHLGQLSSFQKQALALGKISLAQQGVDALSEQMKSGTREAAEGGNASVSGIDTPRKTPINMSDFDKSEKKKNKLSSEEKRRARYLKGRIGQSAANSWQVKNSGEIESKAFNAKYKFDRTTAEKLALPEKAIMIAYLKTYFNDYVQWQQDPKSDKCGSNRCFQGGELEFILEGQRTATTNQFWVNSKLFGIREVVNLAHISKSPEKKTVTGGLAALICALFPIGEPVVQAGLMTLWASIESGYEVNLLLEGKSIPIVKVDGGDWYTDLESGRGQVPPESGKSKLNRIDYSGYLNLFLMAQSDAETAERAMTLIDLNLKKSGHDLKDLSQMITGHRIWVKGKTGKEISFEDGYMQNKASEGQSKR